MDVGIQTTTELRDGTAVAAKGSRQHCFFRNQCNPVKVDLLDTVRRAILRRPDRFCAAQWAFARNATAVLRRGADPEGFRCCVAGHVLLQADLCSEEELLRRGGFHTGGPLWTRAAEALRVGKSTSHQLFFPSQWPSPFKQEYYLCSRDEEASVAADYLATVIVEYQTEGDPDADVRSRNTVPAEKDRTADAHETSRSGLSANRSPVRAEA